MHTTANRVYAGSNPVPYSKDTVMWHTSVGKIVYDPPRPGMKRRTAWWCIVQVDPEIARYYRYWLQWQFHMHHIAPPAWGAHISVIRGEKPTDDLMHLWKKYDGQLVKFKYTHYLMRAKKEQFWFVEVQSPFLMNIREELNRPTNWPLHLTIGKEKY